MRGSIWSVVALGVGVAMVPAILPSSASGSVGTDIFGLVTTLTPLLGVIFAVAVFGLLVVFLGFDNGF
jgi:uncharacterized membrane protein